MREALTREAGYDVPDGGWQLCDLACRWWSSALQTDSRPYGTAVRRFRGGIRITLRCSRVRTICLLVRARSRRRESVRGRVGERRMSTTTETALRITLDLDGTW